MSLKNKINKQREHIEVKEIVQDEQLIQQTNNTPEVFSEEKKQNTERKDYAKKIDKLYVQMKNGDVICEVYEDGFNLNDENKGLETKVHINFSKLNAGKKQQAFIQYYLDLTKFLELKYLLTSGIASTKAVEMKESGKVSEVFSEFKNPEGTDIMKRLTLKPASNADTWFLTATESSKKEGKSSMVSISVSTGRLIAMLELIYLAYQRHLFSKWAEK